MVMTRTSPSSGGKMPKINAEGAISDATLDPDPAFEENQPVDEPVDATAPVLDGESTSVAGPVSFGNPTVTFTPDEADEKSKAVPQKRTTRK